MWNSKTLFIKWNYKQWTPTHGIFIIYTANNTTRLDNANTDLQRPLWLLHSQCWDSCGAEEEAGEGIEIQKRHPLHEFVLKWWYHLLFAFNEPQHCKLCLDHHEFKRLENRFHYHWNFYVQQSNSNTQQQI